MMSSAFLIAFCPACLRPASNIDEYIMSKEMKLPTGSFLWSCAVLCVIFKTERSLPFTSVSTYWSATNASNTFMISWN